MLDSLGSVEEVAAPRVDVKHLASVFLCKRGTQTAHEHTHTYTSFALDEKIDAVLLCLAGRDEEGKEHHRGGGLERKFTLSSAKEQKRGR